MPLSTAKCDDSVRMVGNSSVTRIREESPVNREQSRSPLQVDLSLPIAVSQPSDLFRVADHSGVDAICKHKGVCRYRSGETSYKPTSRNQSQPFDSRHV